MLSWHYLLCCAGVFLYCTIYYTEYVVYLFQQGKQCDPWLLGNGGKERFASVKPSAATVHRTVATDGFKSSISSDQKKKRGDAPLFLLVRATGLDLLFLFCLTEMDGCQQAYRLPPSIHGLFPGLKKCPPDTFLLRLRSAALFESTIRTKKEEAFASSFLGAGDRTRFAFCSPAGAK